jgi:hypothetical protein
MPHQQTAYILQPWKHLHIQQQPLVILACGLYRQLLEDGPLFLQQGLNEHLSWRTHKQHASKFKLKKLIICDITIQSIIYKGVTYLYINKGRARKIYKRAKAI